MSLHRKLVTVILSLCACALSSTVHAQHAGFFGKNDDNSDFTGLYDPFCDLDTCWFEPIDCNCPDERPLNSGWFFGYSRMRLKVSRPRDTGAVFFTPETPSGPGDPIASIYGGNDASELGGDWGWGNRFDFGWVSEEGSGLWLVARKLDSPNARDNFDNIDDNLDDGLRPDGEPWGPTFATVNGLRMWGFEGNKIWRLEPGPKGTVMEPFIGARYVRLRDHADRNDVFTDADDALRFPLTQPPNVTLLDTANFNFRESIITTDNDLFGGQLGMRSRWRRGRWQITSDIRGLMFLNHQVKERIESNETQSQDFVATYGPATPDGTGDLQTVAPVTGNILQLFDQDRIYDVNNTFVYGGEVNLQAAFEVTQGFAITFGGEIIAFADGIGRGVAGIDDSLVLTGFSLGFNFNR